MRKILLSIVIGLFIVAIIGQLQSITELPTSGHNSCELISGDFCDAPKISISEVSWPPCKIGEIPEGIICDCAKNTSTPCMAYCFKCVPENQEKIKIIGWYK